MHVITIDIETIPDQREGAQARAAENVAPPGNYKKPETIEKWWEETGNELKAEAYRKTALDGTTGQIACIGLAIDDGPASVFSQHLCGDEAGVLTAALQYIANATGWKETASRPLLLWVGHNLANFDLRYVWQRCVINGVRPPIKLPVEAKPWDEEIFDTMTKWAGVRGTVGLARLCDALGIAVKESDITGATVWDAWQAGRFEDVADYCAQDVIATREVYKRLTFQSAPAQQEAA